MPNRKRGSHVSTEVEEARSQPRLRASSFVGNIRHPVLGRFGTALRAKRRAIGMTQAELAENSGLSRSYISEVENARESISLERAELLASCVNSRLVELLLS